jgi:hypothetical protein
MLRELRPQDPHRDGSGLTYRTAEHDWYVVPGAITAMDAEGRWCVYCYDAADGLSPEDRPRDAAMNGDGLSYTPLDFGGECRDNMPQTIRVTDEAGRCCLYRACTVDGKVVRSLGFTAIPDTPPSPRAKLKLPRF